MTLIGRPFSFHGHCKPARHGAILFSTEEYRKEILVFKVGSSHVAAGVFNFPGGTVETLNQLVFPAGVKQQRLFFCVQSLRDNPLGFTTPMGGISVAKSGEQTNA